MKKIILIISIIFLNFSTNVFANVYSAEKEVKNQYKLVQQKCAKGMKKMTQEEKIDCLQEQVEYLNFRGELYYIYYMNTLSILNVPPYDGDLKNTKF